MVTVFPVRCLADRGWLAPIGQEAIRTHVAAALLATSLVVIGTLALPCSLLSPLYRSCPSSPTTAWTKARRRTRCATPRCWALLAASAIAGLWWEPKVWLICALFFDVPDVPRRTRTFLHQYAPGCSPAHGARLDYWLEQQDVKRGNQPYYYLRTDDAPL